MTISPDTRPRPTWLNSELCVLEEPLAWLRSYQSGWLAHLEATGEMDWSRYVPPHNRLAPAGAGLQLARARLLLVSLSGYAPHQPFETDNPLGDYSLRCLPLPSAPDVEALQPLQILQKLTPAHFKELCPEVITGLSHQPNALRTVKEFAPAVSAAARRVRAHGALLLARGSLGVQAAALTARALELHGIASAVLGWDCGWGANATPPRLILCHQTDVETALLAGLELLQSPAPQRPLQLA